MGKSKKLAKSCFILSALQIIFETLRVQMNSSDELELAPGFDPVFPRKNPDLSSLRYYFYCYVKYMVWPLSKNLHKKLCDD